MAGRTSVEMQSAQANIKQTEEMVRIANALERIADALEQEEA